MLWRSDSIVVCKSTPSLFGSLKALFLSFVGSKVAAANTSAATFSPLLSGLHSSGDAAPPSSGHSRVAVLGSSFGEWGNTFLSRVGSTAASATVWISQTAIVLKAPRFLPSNQSSNMIIASFPMQLGNANLSVQFATRATSIALINVSNAFPTSGSKLVVIAGANFGLGAFSISVSVLNTFCQSSSWSSESTILVKSAWGLAASPRRIIAVSAGLLSSAGGLSQAFSYQVPTNDLTVAWMNGSSLSVATVKALACGSQNLNASLDSTLFGFYQNSSGFGSFGASVNMSLLGAPCQPFTWVSDSTVCCLYTEPIKKSFALLNFLVNYAVATDSVNLVSVKNPFFVPNPPAISTSLMALFFLQPLQTVPSQDDRSSYQSSGAASGKIFQAPPQVALVALFEVVPVSILLFINASQTYLDDNSLPISKDISGSFGLAGSNAKNFFCQAPQNISITIVAQAFLAVSENSFLWFCSSANSSVQLRFSYSTTNESRAVINLEPVLQNLIFSGINGRESVSAVLQGTAVAGVASNLSINVQYTSGSAVNCTRIRFEFNMILFCGGSEQLFMNPPSELRSTTKSYTSPLSCSVILTSFVFMRASTLCVFKVSIPRANVSTISSVFIVNPGIPVRAILAAGAVVCQSAGSIIWNVNVTDSLCLVAQLLDVENNNASGYDVKVLALGKLIDAPNSTYDLSGDIAASVSTTSGQVRWCKLYSSGISAFSVSFGIRVESNDINWLPGRFNVSSVGPPARFSVKSASLNQTLVPLSAGQRPANVTFSLLDFAGNPITSVGQSICIRITVRFNVSSPKSSRRMFSQNPCESSEIVTYVNVPTGASSVVAAPPLFCAAGQNSVVYDIGIGSGSEFVAVYPAVYTETVMVRSGVFESFKLLQNTHSSQTYALITDVQLVFRDSGLNFVSGSTTLSLLSSTSDVSLYPSSNILVFTNSSAPVALPPFFISINDWDPMFSPQSATIMAINSSIPPYGGHSVTISVQPRCLKGNKLFLPSNRSPSVLYSMLKNASLINVTCQLCSQPKFNSWTLDSLDCFTVVFPTNGSSVTSGSPLELSNIAVYTDSGRLAIKTNGWAVQLYLLKVGESHAQNSAVNIKLNVIDGICASATVVPLYIAFPSSDCFWKLQLMVANINQSSTPVFEVSLPSALGNVSLLDFSPVITAVYPTALSSSGEPLILLIGAFPANSLSRTFFSNRSLFSIRNNSCILLPLANAQLAPVIIPAFNSTFNATHIILQCNMLQLQPPILPYSRYAPGMLLHDGRDSRATLSIEFYCPSGFRINNVSSQCTICPEGSSSTGINVVSDPPCYCNVGYYGAFDKCKKCPKAEGFLCDTVGAPYPTIRPGFFVDYSQLDKCSPFDSICPAITKCPVPEACPGLGEKQCLQTSDFCYSNASAGCIKCCEGFYSSSLKCIPCPSNNIVLILVIAMIALILFAFFSASIDFPPFLSVFVVIKILISSMQNFVSIRLVDIGWPSNVLTLFDITRFFTFSFDILKPECTISYKPETKLLFMLLGPFLMSFVIILVIFVYVWHNCRKISSKLQSNTAVLTLNWGDSRLFWSIAACLRTSTACLKFSPSRIMSDGILWHTLDNALYRRSEMSVLKQFSRRKATAHAVVDQADAEYDDTLIPSEWHDLRSKVLHLNVHIDFLETAKRVRMMISGSLSIFVFTFQGCMETALATFDCENGLLRSSPGVVCSSSNSQYSKMVVFSCIGIAVYCLLLPLGSVMLLRSKWARETLIHDSKAYHQLFQFLLSSYSNKYVLWELVNCLRKLVFIVIPLLSSNDPLIQGLLSFITMLVYMFVALRLKPMRNMHLNVIEILGCIGVLSGCFCSVFLVVEYNGQLLLTGAARDFVGLLFVLLVIFTVALSFRLMFVDVMGLMRLHTNPYVSRWATALISELNDASSERGIFLPLFVMFWDETASADVYKNRRSMFSANSGLSKRSVRNSAVFGRILKWISLRWNGVRSLVASFRYRPPPESIEVCLQSPEMEALVYLHKLTKRVDDWQDKSGRFADDDNESSFWVSQGPADPPPAEVEYQSDVINMLEQALPPNVHRVFTALMFSEMMNSSRKTTSAQRKYLPCPVIFFSASSRPFLFKLLIN